jgi:hypothetical protein
MNAHPASEDVQHQACGALELQHAAEWPSRRWRQRCRCCPQVGGGPLPAVRCGSWPLGTPCCYSGGGGGRDTGSTADPCSRWGRPRAAGGTESVSGSGRTCGGVLRSTETAVGWLPPCKAGQLGAQLFAINVRVLHSRGCHTVTQSRGRLRAAAGRGCGGRSPS